MVRQDREVEAGERDAARHGAELLCGLSKCGGERGRGGDVAGDVLQMAVWGKLGNAGVEAGYFGAGDEQSGDWGGANVARASCYQDVGEFSMRQLFIGVV